MANLGLQNKNPGNLKDATTGEFRVFNTDQEGESALTNDIDFKKSGKSSHIKPGGTIADFGNVWAPVSDNNVQGEWANNFAKTIGKNPTDAWADIPTVDFVRGVKGAEGTTTPSTINNSNKANVATSGGSSKPPLNRQQMIENIEALEKQGASQEEVQSYIDERQKTSGPKFPYQTGGDKEKTKDTSNEAWKIDDTYTGRPLALEQGLGYALSNMMGTQDKAIKASEDMGNTQAELLKRIKENKAKGKDTTKLQEALKTLTADIEKAGGQITDIGTGGITNNQVYASAGLHGLAAAGGYGASALRGTATLARGSFKPLTSAQIINTKNMIKMKDALPYVQDVTGITPKVFATLKRTEQLNVLSEALTANKGLAGNIELIANAIKVLQPEAGWISKLLKYGGLTLAAEQIIRKLFGDKIGSAVSTVAGLVK